VDREDEMWIGDRNGLHHISSFGVHTTINWRPKPVSSTDNTTHWSLVVDVAGRNAFAADQFGSRLYRIPLPGTPSKPSKTDRPSYKRKQEQLERDAIWPVMATIMLVLMTSLRWLCTKAVLPRKDHPHVTTTTTTTATNNAAASSQKDDTKGGPNTK
jgi:hypothetical protein